MLENISNKNLLNITPEQMSRSSVRQPQNNTNLLSFNIFSNDKVNIVSNQSRDNSNVPPMEQINKLAQKYNIPFEGDVKTFQKRVIKAVVMHKAIQYNIPLNIALGISGNESNWSMWKDISKGKLEQCKNVREGILKSSDWGAMQINDKAHAKAFPRVKYDLEYNIDYGLKFLSNRATKAKGDLGLGFGEWDRTIASYNLGHNPTSARDHEIAQKYVSRVKKRSLAV